MISSTFKWALPLSCCRRIRRRPARPLESLRFSSVDELNPKLVEVLIGCSAARLLKEQTLPGVRDRGAALDPEHEAAVGRVPRVDVSDARIFEELADDVLGLARADVASADDLVRGAVS